VKPITVIAIVIFVLIVGFVVWLSMPTLENMMSAKKVNDNTSFLIERYGGQGISDNNGNVCTTTTFDYVTNECDIPREEFHEALEIAKDNIKVIKEFETVEDCKIPLRTIEMVNNELNQKGHSQSEMTILKNIKAMYEQTLLDYCK
jgi:hypothetical protein